MEENKKEEEKKAEEDQGPNGCIVCLQATWDVIYVSYHQFICFVILNRSMGLPSINHLLTRPHFS